MSVSPHPRRRWLALPPLVLLVTTLVLEPDRRPGPPPEPGAAREPEEVSRLALDGEVARVTLSGPGAVEEWGALGERIEFRDHVVPGSSELGRIEVTPLAWEPYQRTIVEQHLYWLHERLPGLLPRSTCGESLRLFRGDLLGMAGSACHRSIVLDDEDFPWADREQGRYVMTHEVVHAADAYGRFARADAFREVVAPRVEELRRLLQSRDLTPLEAAMTGGHQRRELDELARDKTGLPSAYSGENLSEALAEIVAFWLASSDRYEPPAALLPPLREFVQRPVAPHPEELAYERARHAYERGAHAEAMLQLEYALETAPGFVEALKLRGQVLQYLDQVELAERSGHAALRRLSPMDIDFVALTRWHGELLAALEDERREGAAGGQR